MLITAQYIIAKNSPEAKGKLEFLRLFGIEFSDEEALNKAAEEEIRKLNDEDVRFLIDEETSTQFINDLRGDKTSTSSTDELSEVKLSMAKMMTHVSYFGSFLIALVAKTPKYFGWAGFGANSFGSIFGFLFAPRRVSRKYQEMFLILLLDFIRIIG